MAIRFVIGSEGSGTTEWMHREMLRLNEEEPERAVYCIVPDQATLQAQKELVYKQQNGCVMNIDILSFSRLKYRLSEELGDCFPPVLDDIGKNMLLKKVLVSAEDRLQLYQHKHNKPGFLSELKSMLSELQRYLVDAKKLKELSDSEEDPILKGKLSDLSVVLSDFRELLGNRFLTEEDIYSAMCGPVERSVKLRDADIFLYGFTGFTPSQFLLLRSLMRVSHTMTVALSMDRELYGSREVYDSIFKMTQRTIDGIRHIAKEEEIAEADPVILQNPPVRNALSFLQNNLFRRNGKKFEETVSGVSVHSLPAKSDEIRFLLTEIERMVQHEGYRYREIGVICGDVQEYAQEIEEAAEENGIPCFIDYKSDLMSDPLVDLIRSVFRVFYTNFRTDAVTHYMKNVLSGYSFEEACIMENYLIAKGIRGASAYRNPFRFSYKTGHKNPLEQANKVREKIANDLLPLLDNLKTAEDVSACVRLLYDYLLKHDCAKKLNELSKELETVPGRKALAKCGEYSKIYKTVIDLLDQLDVLMGDMKLPLGELAEVMEAGFAELKLGRIPPEQDSVMVGDVKRSRLDGVRCLFLLGVNEGSLPKFSQGSGILSDKEREYLQQKNVELSELSKESLPTEEFYIYLAVSKPSECLRLCYHRAGEAGREAKASYVIYRILGLLTKLETSNEHTDRSLFAQIAPDRARQAYLDAVSDEKEADAFSDAVLAWFNSEVGMDDAPENRDWLESAKAGEPVPGKIPGELARQLYGNRFEGGVTALETYATCPFRTFLSRGLKLEERAEYMAASTDVGLFLHAAMERYSKAVKESGTTFRLISDEDSRALMNRTIDELLSEEEREVFQSSNRNAFTAYEAREILLHMTDMIRSQLKAGKFEPEEFEKAYSHSSEAMELSGKIDRVDTFREDGKTYVKIIDYKSSDRNLDFGKIYDGTMAQLPVYMKAVIRENEAENIPAAMFYETLDNPYVNADDETGAETQRSKEARPVGIVLDDKTVIRYVDNTDPEDISKSKVAALSEEMCLSLEEMKKLSDYAERKMEQEAKEILGGNIKQDPIYTSFTSNTCKWCAYTDFCTNKIRNKEGFRGNTALKKTEFFEAIEKKNQE